MKKFVILSTVLLLAALILQPGSSNGKYNVSKPASASTLVADGWPLPLPPPPPSTSSASTLVADGWPLPLPPPLSSSNANVQIA